MQLLDPLASSPLSQARGSNVASTTYVAGLKRAQPPLDPAHACQMDRRTVSSKVPAFRAEHLAGVPVETFELLAKRARHHVSSRGDAQEPVGAVHVDETGAKGGFGVRDSDGLERELLPSEARARTRARSEQTHP